MSVKHKMKTSFKYRIRTAEQILRVFPDLDRWCEETGRSMRLHNNRRQEFGTHLKTHYRGPALDVMQEEELEIPIIEESSESDHESLYHCQDDNRVSGDELPHKTQSTDKMFEDHHEIQSNPLHQDTNDGTLYSVDPQHQHQGNPIEFEDDAENQNRGDNKVNEPDLLVEDRTLEAYSLGPFQEDDRKIESNPLHQDTNDGRLFPQHQYQVNPIVFEDDAENKNRGDNKVNEPDLLVEDRTLEDYTLGPFQDYDTEMDSNPLHQDTNDGRLFSVDPTHQHQANPIEFEDDAENQNRGDNKVNEPDLLVEDRTLEASTLRPFQEDDRVIDSNPLHQDTNDGRLFSVDPQHQHQVNPIEFEDDAENQNRGDNKVNKPDLLVEDRTLEDYTLGPFQEDDREIESNPLHQDTNDGRLFLVDPQHQHQVNPIEFEDDAENQNRGDNKINEPDLLVEDRTLEDYTLGSFQGDDREIESNALHQDTNDGRLFSVDREHQHQVDPIEFEDNAQSQNRGDNKVNEPYLRVEDRTLEASTLRPFQEDDGEIESNSLHHDTNDGRLFTVDPQHQHQGSYKEFEDVPDQEIDREFKDVSLHQNQGELNHCESFYNDPINQNHDEEKNMKDHKMCLRRATRIQRLTNWLAKHLFCCCSQNEDDPG